MDVSSRRDGNVELYIIKKITKTTNFILSNLKTNKNKRKKQIMINTNNDQTQHISNEPKD